MKKATCVILGIAFIALGILGLTGLIPKMSVPELFYVYIGEIVIGFLGLAVGVYTRQSIVNLNLRTDISKQEKGIDQQGKEIDRQGKEIDQQRKEIDLQRIEIDKQKEENVQEKK
jgi:membrane-bound ClpP family serine protease